MLGGVKGFELALSVKSPAGFTIADEGKTVEIKDGVVTVDAAARTVEWGAPGSATAKPSDCTGKIVRVEPSVLGLVTLDSGVTFKNPDGWSKEATRNAFIKARVRPIVITVTYVIIYHELLLSTPEERLLMITVVYIFILFVLSINARGCWQLTVVILARHCRPGFGGRLWLILYCF